MFDRDREGKVRPETGIIALFQQGNDGFAFLLRVEGPFGVFSGPMRIGKPPDSESNAPEWQDRGIIAVYLTGVFQ